MSKQGARAAEEVRVIISKMRAKDKSAWKLLLELEDMVERVYRISQILIKRKPYSENYADASQLQKELLDRVLVKPEIFMNLDAEALSEFLRGLEHNLLLSQQETSASTGPAKKADDTSIPS